MSGLAWEGVGKTRDDSRLLTCSERGELSRRSCLLAIGRRLGTSEAQAAIASAKASIASAKASAVRLGGATRKSRISGIRRRI